MGKNGNISWLSKKQAKNNPQVLHCLRPSQGYKMPKTKPISGGRWNIQNAAMRREAVEQGNSSGILFDHLRCQDPVP